MLPSQLGNPGSPPGASPLVLSEFVLMTRGAGEGQNSQQLELGAPLVFRAAPQNVALHKPTNPEPRRTPEQPPQGGTAPCSSPAQAQASSIFKHRVRKPAAKAAFRIDAEQKAAARGRGSEAQPRVLPRSHSPAGNLTLTPVTSDRNIRGFNRGVGGSSVPARSSTKP